MKQTGFKRVCHVFLFSIILFSSCSNKKENCLDLSHSFSYLNVGSEAGTIEQITSREKEFQKLDKWGHCNISDIAGISGNYVWVKADFEVPENLKDKDLSFFVSYIHFAEKTYLNGELIGESGVFPDKNGKGERSSMYSTHLYRLGSLREGKNTIYIQVYSKGHAECSGYCLVGPSSSLSKLSTYNAFWSSRFYLLLCSSPFITFLLFIALFITNRKHKDWNNYFFAMENIFTIGMLAYFFASEVPLYENWGIPHIWYTKIFLCCGTCLVIHFVSLFTINFINGSIPKKINIIQEVLLILIVIIIILIPTFEMLMNLTWPIASLAFIKFCIGFYYPICGLKKEDKKKKSIIFLLAFSPFYITIVAFEVIVSNIDYSMVSYWPVLGQLLSNFVFIIILCKNMNKVQEDNEYLNENLEREIQLQTVDLTFANERLEQEINRSEKDLEMASVVQQKFMLPEHREMKGWEISILYEPLSKVSGDLYDYYYFEDDLKGFSLFDVSGHGIAASLVTMLAKEIIFKTYKKAAPDENVSDTLLRINESIIKSKGDIENYLTGLLFRIIPNEDGSSKIQMASAGHPYPIWYSTKADDIELLLLAPEQIQVGAIGIKNIEVSYPSIEFELQKGDVLVACTDGLFESYNENHEQFGRERAEQIVKQNHNLSCDEIKEKIISELNKFIADTPRDDDVTIIVLKKV